MPISQENRVIAHYLTGQLIKGTTLDFFPTKDRFHVTGEDGNVHEIRVEELKAIFFVKNFEGNTEYAEKKGFFTKQSSGKKVLVEFKDGEVLFGYTLSYSTKGLGFFMFPGDPECNNTKVFIIHSSTKRVKVQTLPSGHSQYTT